MQSFYRTHNTAGGPDFVIVKDRKIMILLLFVLMIYQAWVRANIISTNKIGHSVLMCNDHKLIIVLVLTPK